MKLSQLFSGQNHVEEQTHAQPQTSRNTAVINRQIRSLVPGQTISGEIVGRNGGEVQIRLADDMVLNARVDRSLNIEIGRNMTFEVKNNGSSLTLSPLFTNVATDVNVLKALDMASLPVNPASVAMTEKLMEAGLPVNRNNLLQVYREINSFPQAEVSDIVNLHRLQMPVNEANLQQMESYRSLTHQLLQGMESVTETLPQVFDSLQAAGDAAGAVKLYQEIFLLVQEGGQEETEAAASVPETAEGLQETAMQGEGLPDTAGQSGAPEQGTVIIREPGVSGTENGQIQLLNPDFIPPKSENKDGKLLQGAALPQGGQAEEAAGRNIRPETSNVPEALRAAVSEEALAMVKDLPLTQQQISQVTEQVNRFAAGEIDGKQLIQSLTLLAESVEAQSQGTNTEGGMQALAKMFSQPAFRELLYGQVKNHWTVSPEEVAEPGRVEELYRRLDRQLKGLSQALENAGQTDSAAYKAVSNMTQNVDFLQQINQMYAYVQLPLRLQQQGEAHGELFVYTNKKHLAQADGKVSALLHLDMEYLGLVDVYVTLQESKVNTNFRVQDDEMLDFLAQHMDLLTERLKKRGYDCSFSMTTREKGDSGTTESGIGMILRQEKGVSLAQYAFDVRT